MSPVPATTAVELTDQMLRLVQAGTPLVGGLEALADELPDAHTARTLRLLASQLAQGRSASDAVRELVGKLPSDLGVLMSAGERTGRLPELLEHYVVKEQVRRNYRTEWLAVLAYPVLIFTLAIIWAGFMSLAVIRPLFDVIGELDLSPSSAPRFLLAIGEYAVYIPIAGLMLAGALVVTRVVAGPVRFSYLVDAIPLCARIRRNSGAAELCESLALLTEAQTPLPVGLESASWAVRNPGVRSAAQRAAQRVAGGTSLAQAAAAEWILPPLLSTIAAWGEQRGDLATALGIAGQLFRQHAAIEQETIRVPILTMLFAAVSLFVGVIVMTVLVQVTMFMQLLSL